MALKDITTRANWPVDRRRWLKQMEGSFWRTCLEGAQQIQLLLQKRGSIILPRNRTTFSSILTTREICRRIVKIIFSKLRWWQFTMRIFPWRPLAITVRSLWAQLFSQPLLKRLAQSCWIIRKTFIISIECNSVRVTWNSTNLMSLTMKDRVDLIRAQFRTLSSKRKLEMANGTLQPILETSTTAILSSNNCCREMVKSRKVNSRILISMITISHVNIISLWNSCSSIEARAIVREAFLIRKTIQVRGGGSRQINLAIISSLLSWPNRRIMSKKTSRRSTKNFRNSVFAQNPSQN